ncbi:KEOPS complex Pcc1 subunit [Sulfolobus sp. A20]|uniref:KEOPS complex Pcc1 subunit n=1 Tax=Sulfolobaceae TaxID=118883 RepID=UPI000845D586|nr:MULTISPECIES: KEOPS complex Pcc1 subunit [unclassified Sulfolobus]AOL15767.1 KEOPS complex Pcc1 subunit [Sulfolobus sp. A20]
MALVEIKLKDEADDAEKFKNIEDIIYNSIIIEKIDTKYVKIERDPLRIIINSPTLTRTRAIMNSYILWLYTILKSLEEVK